MAPMPQDAPAAPRVAAGRGRSLRALLRILAVACALGAAGTVARAADGPIPDTLRIEETSARPGERGIALPVLLSHAEPLLALSIGVCVESEALALQGFTLEGTAIEDAEGVFSRQDETCGDLGVILDFDPPYDRGPLAPAPSRPVAVLLVEVLPDAPAGAAAVRLTRETGPVGIPNVYTNAQGMDVRPALLDGAVVVEDTRPVIDAVEPALALEGETIRVIGRGFIDDGGFRVLVDGEPVPFEHIGPEEIRFVAPASGEEADRTVEVCHGRRCAQGGYASRPGPPFRRGDASRDEQLDLADAIAILGHLFQDGSIPCDDAADANDDGVLDLGDAIWLLNYLFNDGPTPPPPHAAPGPDPTPDPLRCGA